MAKSILHGDTVCTVCASPMALAVADFPHNDKRRPAYSPLFLCLGCESAFFQHEPREGSTLAWHQKVYERNIEWSKVLYPKIASIRPFKSVIDIGCGIGTWLSYVKSQGDACLGFDTAKACVDYGAERFELNLRSEYFSASHPEANDFRAELLTCIMVMEHLPDPRLLASEMATYCLAHNSAAFVSVPFFNDKRHLNFDDESKDYNLFNDVGAHVTYFSDAGMKKMFASFGLEHAGTVFAGSWRGMMFKPPAGVAKQFLDGQSSVNSHGNP